MSVDLRKRVLPAIHRHFSKPPMRKRLRTIAAWGNSFEGWVQWETVFALGPTVQRMAGDPWDYEAWDIEHRVGRVRWDMVLRGAKPLFLQFKILIPCWGIPPKFRAGRNSMAADIETVRRVRSGSAAALLFALEHGGAETQFEKARIPMPDGPCLPEIDIGRAWCESCHARRATWLRVYCWTNCLYEGG